MKVMKVCQYYIEGTEISYTVSSTEEKLICFLYMKEAKELALEVFAERHMDCPIEHAESICGEIVIQKYQSVSR